MKKEISFHSLKEIDEELTKAFSLSAKPSSPLGLLRPLFKLLEVSCHGIPWLVVCLALLWFTTNLLIVTYALNLLIALLIDIVIVSATKAVVRRERPKHNSTKDMFLTFSVDKLSFPSGHSSRAVLIWFIFANTLSLPKIWNVLLALWCVSVCASRVLLGRHHVMDVIFGGLTGAIEHKLVLSIWLGSDKALYILKLLSIF